VGERVSGIKGRRRDRLIRVQQASRLVVSWRVEERCPPNLRCDNNYLCMLQRKCGWEASKLPETAKQVWWQTRLLGC
jgi:hypothetical protein